MNGSSILWPDGVAETSDLPGVPELTHQNFSVNCRVLPPIQNYCCQPEWWIALGCGGGILSHSHMPTYWLPLWLYPFPPSVRLLCQWCWGETETKGDRNLGTWPGNGNTRRRIVIQQNYPKYFVWHCQEDTLSLKQAHGSDVTKDNTVTSAD